MSSWMQELHLAVANDDMATFKAIVAKEEVRNDLEDIIQWDFDNCEAPLHQAALSANVTMLTMLLDAGADVNSYATRLEGQERETALHCAIRWEKQSVVRMFNGKTNGEVFKGEVCKQRKNQTQIVRLLMERGADTSLKGRCSTYDDPAVDLKKPLSGTPLDYAKQVRNKTLISILASEPESMPWSHEGNCALL